MKRSRRLRRLLLDEELVGRRAAGEPLRLLAVDYGVAHTTLARWFGRPEVAGLLRQARRGVRVERRALVARRGEERRLLAQLRGRAREEAGRRAGRRSRADELAEEAVCAGGGIEAVVEATRLRTRETVLRLIDPAVLVRALANDRAAQAVSEPGRERLRRLRPDDQLLCRRAAGEPLRLLAVDYGVAHTTLGRWFQRPEMARRLRELRRRQPRVAGEAGAGEAAGRSVALGRRYRRLTGADLELIAYWCVRGASDAMIAGELGCDRSSVRRARARPATRELIAAELEQEARKARRAEVGRERARKHRRRQAEPVRAEQAAAQTAPADTSPATPASAIPQPGAELDGLVRLRSPDGTIHAWHDQNKLDDLLAQGWSRT